MPVPALPGAAAPHPTARRASREARPPLATPIDAIIMDTITVRIDGQPHQLSCLWLRLNDPGRHTDNGQRTFEVSDIVNDGAATIIVSSHTDEDGLLHASWADGASSDFPLEWLKRHVCHASREVAASATYLWNSGLAKLLPEVEFEDLAVAATQPADGSVLGKRPRPEVQGDGKLRLSSYMAKYGLAIIRNVPVKLGMVAEVGNLLGHVRTTNYGAVFDVVDLGSSGNSLAQTNVRINAHTDNPYRDPFPTVQLLHCLVSAPEGGATRLTDGFAAAEALRARDPAAFRLLASTPHPFEYRDPSSGVLLRAEAPVISLDGEGRLVRIAFNNRSAATLPPGRLSPAGLRAYYTAWAAFDALCNADEFVLRIALRPGDLALFSNGRVMHGREEYTRGAPRHLQGCYIDHDALRARLEWSTYASSFSAASEPRVEGAAEERAPRGAHERATALESAAQRCIDADGAKARGDAHGDVHLLQTGRLLEALATQATFTYGEGLNMLEHALQAAECASSAGEAAPVVLACLMHDVGNAPQARDAWREATGEDPPMLMDPAERPIGYAKHSAMGGLYLRRMGFAEEVASACELHVSAKRALVAMEPTYLNELSQASVDTLKHQGGPLTPRALAEFNARAGAAVALRLRRYDDRAKEPGRKVPRLEAYASIIHTHLRAQSAAESSAS